VGGGKFRGYWNIWGGTLEIDSYYPNVDIEGVGTYQEGDSFQYNGHDFKIKKTDSANRFVYFQPTDTGFGFDDFISGEKCVDGNRIINNNGCSAATYNDNVIWVSNFPDGHEYISLLKSAIFSLNLEWVLIQGENPEEPVGVTNFLNLCCDMPETAELITLLWYSY
jgi:hypothetical protein